MSLVLRTLFHLLEAPQLPLLGCALLAIACGPSSSDEVAASADPGPTTSGGAACAAPEVALPDGNCIRPGIPPDGCSEGFEHDGEYGCDAILPAESCLPGMMAVPGDTVCRPVMPCGTGSWGDLAVDATTQYVDGSYLGGASDGSSNNPWTTIRAAYQASLPGALIAVAAGRYAERTILASKPVVIWGVCPAKVLLVGDGANDTLFVGPGASGSEIGGMAITSAKLGIRISGATDIKLDRMWIHDTGSAAIALLYNPTRASVHVEGSLFELSREAGIYALGSDVTLTRSVVRDTRPRPSDQMGGTGIRAEMACDPTGCDDGTRPTVALEHSRIQGNHTHGIFLLGGDLDMKASLVRGTLPQPADQTAGRGVRLRLGCYAPDRCDPAQPSRASIEGSLIDDNHTSGIYVEGSDLELSSTVIRNTLPQAGDQNNGEGMSIYAVCTTPSCDVSRPSSATIRTSLVEDNHAGGIVVSGSSATIETTVARRTLPRQRDLKLGTGIAAQLFCSTPTNCSFELRSLLQVTDSLVEENYLTGISIMESDAQLSSTVVRETYAQQRDNLFGDGVVVLNQRNGAVGTFNNLSIQNNARAGLANFGADVSLGASTIACATFALVAQDKNKLTARFYDEGDNYCGCPAATEVCKAVSAGLKPPELFP